MAESQAFTVLAESYYDDPSQLSQALRQRAGSDRPLHFTTSTESPHSGNTASTATFAVPQPPNRDCAPQQPPVVLAQLDHAPSARRAATAKYVHPALPKHHSAPTLTRFVKETEGALRMHHSFNVMDAPGDTQPDSQMHKLWTSGIGSTTGELENHMRPPRPLFVEHGEEDDNDLPTDGSDDVDSSQEHRNATITSPTVVDVDEHAQNSWAPTSPLKFETPALPGGRKRGSSGQILSSAVRTDTTPGTVASPSAFGVGFGNVGFANGPPMSLTQVWNNTQAPTSPAVGAANEDVVFTRPSPNFTNARHSSPIPAYSSPIKASRPDTSKSDPIIRSSSEPRTEYVTMSQSQEKRKSSIGDDHLVKMEQDSWGELSRQVKLKKAKEHFYQQAARSLSHISAPTSASPRSVRKSLVEPKYTSPVKSRVSRSSVYDRPQGEDDESMDELSQAIPVERHDPEDSPDELSQDLHVPPTARTAVNHNSKDNRVQVPKTSSHPHRTPSDQTSPQHTRSSSQLQRESQSRAPGSQSLLRGTFRPQSSKESVAVMDSQPDVLADFDSIPQPKSLRFPSSPSTNQYSINQTTMATKTGYTSQVISSSIPPLPPKSSPEELDDAPEQDVTPEEERVPSSPPILTHDEDIEYDEHTYDEYAEGVEDQNAAEPLAVDEDVVMDDEDDLPVAKGEPTDEEAAEVNDDQLGEEPDLIEPRKVDLGTDQEVPETLEQEDVEATNDERHNEVDEPPLVPRLRRQNTVPETDALDETQPSFFPDIAPVESVDRDTDLPNHTNSTKPFQTAQEEQSWSQANKPAPLSSKQDGSDTKQAGDRICSVNDIYNLPETQSTAEEEIEMPRLSGLDEEEGQLLSGLSPAPPSAKRRKITYTAKRNVFRSPVKPMANSDILSDPPPSSPLNEVHPAREHTPPTASAQQREGQGATAAIHAREEARVPYARLPTLKPKVLPRPTKPQNQRKGALKPISKELLQSLSSPLTSPSKSKRSATSRASTPITPTKSSTVVRGEQADIDMPDADDEPDELAGPTPQPLNVEQAVASFSQRSGMSTAEVVVPNRVFASWPGSHYYPATCVGRAASRQLRIRYDDGNMTTMDAVHVRAFDLRTGDHVKVDETGMKKNTYVVVGFKDKIDDLDSEEFPATDRLGYATIVLEAKQRDSLPKAKAMQQAEHISVPMASVYLTTGLWTRLRDRSFKFSPPASPPKSASRLGTPVTEPLATPSFTRRGTTAPSLLKDAAARAASVASTTRSGSGVFSNMAFVLTSTAADVDKEAIAKMVKVNGGQILEHGFHELFDYESLDIPSSQSRRRSASAVEGSVGLALKHAYRDLGFVALISDSHSRSTKYIQALALNVPCLHLRWIQDSLAASCAVPFTKYLLPAGVSKFLDPNGVVRSRPMQIYDPAADDVSFAQTINDRDLLLQGQTVLIVTGKSKKDIEKRQPFVFLSHALGSANVGRCADLDAASQMLNDGQWDWVYVDGGDGGVADAAAELFGTAPGASAKTPKPKKGKKRRRDENEEKEELVVKGKTGGRQVRVTCAEFVIQSLILGALAED